MLLVMLLGVAPGARCAEWFFNTTTSLLYLFYNGTGAPNPKDAFVATNLKVCMVVP